MKKLAYQCCIVLFFVSISILPTIADNNSKSKTWTTWVPTEEDKEFMYYFENKLTKMNTNQYFGEVEKM